jgi:hypothetical protein
MKHLQLSSGKNIWIFDDVFKFNDVQAMELFCQKSAYRLGATSTPLLNNAKYTFMQSVFSVEDVNNFGVFNSEETKQFNFLLGGKVFDAAWVLASAKSDKFFYHSDVSKGDSGVTVLYCVNSTWDKDWGNEMLFASDICEVEHAVAYRPNRVIVFDSVIPHKPTAISIDAPQYAYMFVAQFLDTK